jgi:hypothetical protein
MKYTRSMTQPMTTIKVPRDLRARISREAAAQGTTAGGLISALLDDHEKRARLLAVGRAYASIDDAYVAEVDLWDTVAADGLDE